MSATEPRGPARGTPAREALQGAIVAIGAGGSDTPRLDAELLLAHVLGVTREQLLLDGELAVAGPAVRSFQDVVRRRAIEREPVAYILGIRHFRHLSLAVDPRALIPRPETELLVEVALAELARGARVLDLGTGSGAVALALAHERSDLRVSASDISAEALALAGANAARLGIELPLIRADLLAGVSDEFDAIVANLPYVREDERETLPPEILRHEPADALFAGPDGLGAIRALFAQLTLRERAGTVVLEVGAGQADPVRELARAAGYAATRAEPDLAGIERVVVAGR